MCEISDEILGIFCIPPSPQSFPRTVPKVPNFASSGHAQAGRVHATTKVRRLQSLRPFSGQQGILWCTQNIWTQLKYPFQSEKSFQCMCVFPRSSSPICLLTVIALPIAVTPLYWLNLPPIHPQSPAFSFSTYYIEIKEGVPGVAKNTLALLLSWTFFIQNMWIINLVDGTGSSHCFTPRCVTSDLSWNDPHLREKVIRQITNSSHTSPTRYKNKLAIAKLWGY